MQFVEGSVPEVDRYCALLQARLGVERATASACGNPLPGELRDEIDGLRDMQPHYRVWGGYEGNGLVIRSEEPVDFHPDGRVVKEFTPQVIATTGIKPGSYRAVKNGLFAVVNEAHGTGGMARLYEVKVAGKTGTSQVIKLRDNQGNVPYQYRDHALFVAFAPFDKPEVAVGVVVEHGEHGGGAAASIAGSILRAYFEKKGVIKKPVKKTDTADENEAAPDAVKEE